MPGTLQLALRYIAYYRGRTAILVAAITLTMFLPLATGWTIRRFEVHAMHRAKSTPLVIGAKGSRFGLTIHCLYFRGESPPTFPMAKLKRIDDFRLAETIPLLARFRAQGFSIVGTTGAYVDFRGLRLERGEPLQRLGDCLLGAKVARELRLAPGDRLLSEAENMFDLSGPSPLNMRVTGILHPTGTTDDEIVLCDLETAWVIQGIGHGHNVVPVGSADKMDSETDDSSSHKHQASLANFLQHTEITDQNLSSFHFHGRKEDYPLTAIIAIPDSDKSEAILVGKYLASDETNQIIRPVEVVDELMTIVGRVRRLFDLCAILLSVATCLMVGLVLTLSVRLRQREIRTLYLLGSSRFSIMQILFTELALIVATSLGLAVILALAAARCSDAMMTALM